MFAQGGTPPGLFNLVTCSRPQISEVSDAICTSNDISKVSFTGSTAVGRVSDFKYNVTQVTYCIAVINAKLC